MTGIVENSSSLVTEGLTDRSRDLSGAALQSRYSVRTDPIDAILFADGFGEETEVRLGRSQPNAPLLTASYEEVHFDSHALATRQAAVGVKGYPAIEFDKETSTAAPTNPTDTSIDPEYNRGDDDFSIAGFGRTITSADPPMSAPPSSSYFMTSRLLIAFYVTRPVMARTAILAMLFLVATSCVPSAEAFDIVNRWGATQIDGGGLQRGDPVTLRWSVVPDGQSYDRSENSELIDFLDDGWYVRPTQRGPDFTNRVWWTVISDAYAQYGRVSGVSFEYVAEQSPSGASTGMFGDIRIGGEPIDGTPGGALADNTFPNLGDMRIDTIREGDGTIGSAFSTEPGLRNLVIHETGHGVGLGHTDFVNNSAKGIMEGGLRTDIWGLQFDDVYALNRQYGDPQEQNGGNDTASSATFLGDLGTSGVVSLGVDSDDSVVEQFDGDWLGIDGRDDDDWFRFTTTGTSFANITLTPQGPTYETEQQGVFNAAAQNDLILQLYEDGPTPTLVEFVNDTGVGNAETISTQLLPTSGDYLIRVRGGREDANQFYRLDLEIDELILADLNLDGSVDLSDWSIFVENSGTATGSLSQLEALQLGDLDFDGDNDYFDFKLFKSSYAAANGSSSLALLTQASVPEPSTFGLLTLAGLTASVVRRLNVPSIGA